MEILRGKTESFLESFSCSTLPLAHQEGDEKAEGEAKAEEDEEQEEVKDPMEESFGQFKIRG